MKLFLKELTTFIAINESSRLKIMCDSLIFKISATEWEWGISIVYEENFTISGPEKRVSRRTLMKHTVESGTEL